MVEKMFRLAKEWWSDVDGTRPYQRYRDKEDRKRRLAGQVLTLITIALGVVYLVWHWNHINWDVWYYSFVFFLAELTGLALFSFFALNAWFLRYHAPEGIPVDRALSVDVFIPVAGEPIELLKRTIEAAVRIDFQNKRVFVLDDKSDEAVMKLAETNGCGYFARDDRSDAKAGNMNHAFHRTDGDLILALDADQVPHPQIIDRLVGYFRIPGIAFVQTKQDYRLPIGDPFGNADRIFYNVMQSGKDNDNSAFSCGSGVVYRRAALAEIGGFSTWNLVEDVHTSMLLHERGWRSVYHDHPLSKGTAPADIYGVYRQRRQWAADSLRILFWDGPYRRKGLSFKQKLQYFHLGFVYLVAAFVMPFFFITPILALLTQEFVLTAPVPDYVVNRFPYFMAMSLAYGLINYPTPYMKAFQMWTGLFPVFIHATWIALRSRKRKPEYRVNVKPVGDVRVRNPWPAVLPQLSIILLSVFAVIYAFLAGNVAWDFYLLNFIWAMWAIWTMSGICLAAVRKHKWPPEEPQQEALREQKAPSYFRQTRELLFAVLASILILVLFTNWGPLGMDRRLGESRQTVLRAIGLEKPAVGSGQALPEAIRVPAPDLQPAVTIPPRESVKETVSSADWAVQIIAVRTQKWAAIYREQLKAAGFPAYTVPARVRGVNWIRVRSGFYASEEEALEASRKIRRTLVAFNAPHAIAKVSEEEKKGSLLGN